MDQSSPARSTLEALSRNLGFSYRRIAECAGRATFVDDEVSMADQGFPFAFPPNNVTFLRPVGDGAAVIRHADEVFGTRRYVVWTIWPLDLAALGFVRAESPAMVCAPSASNASAAAIEIGEVVDAETAAAYERTITLGFGLDKHGPTLGGPVFRDLAGDERLRLWLGKVDGNPVATSWSAVSDGYVGIYGVTTLPQMRRRGYGEALTRAAMMAAPGLPAVLQPSIMGRPLYERMGFREVARFDVWRPAPAE